MTLLESRTGLPRHDRVLSELVAAERAEGWLARCHDAGLFLVPTVELLDGIARLLPELDVVPMLEVCAGDGTLARSLRDRGVEVVATDARPTGRPWEVRALTADEALARYRPGVVIGSFVPVDSRVDGRVLGDPGVRHYLVIDVRIGHGPGSPAVRDRPGWSRRRLPELERWLVTRHDAWLGDHLPIVHRGEAWLLSRMPSGGPGAESAADGRSS